MFQVGLQCEDDSYQTNKGPHRTAEPDSRVGYLHVDIHVLPSSFENRQVLLVFQDRVAFLHGLDKLRGPVLLETTGGTSAKSTSNNIGTHRPHSRRQRG